MGEGDPRARHVALEKDHRWQTKDWPIASAKRGLNLNIITRVGSSVIQLHEACRDKMPLVFVGVRILPHILRSASFSPP